MPQDLEYVVQEKVHGANTSFLCDGETLKFAKRTSMLEEGEQFYDYPELLERYRDRVMKLFCGIKAKYPEATHISVFGEMFGGLYPHDGVMMGSKQDRKSASSKEVSVILLTMSFMASTSTSLLRRVEDSSLLMRLTRSLRPVVSFMPSPFSEGL